MGQATRWQLAVPCGLPQVQGNRGIDKAVPEVQATQRGSDMIAGVVIDSWKLDIYKKHLTEAGFTFTEHPQLTKGTALLKVTTHSAAVLQPVVEAAQLACERSRKH